jgi:hypothetical protein
VLRDLREIVKQGRDLAPGHADSCVTH